MDMVVATDEVPYAVVTQAGEEGVLPSRVRVRVATEHGVLVVLGDKGLVGEDEGVLRAARVLVEPVADPALLIVDRVTIGVTIGIVVDLAGRGPGIHDDEAGVVIMVTIVKRVAHAGQIRANQDGAVEIHAELVLVTVALDERACLGLRVVRLENRDGVIVVRAIGLVVATEREEADTSVDQRLGGGSAGNFGNVIPVVG